MADKYCVSRGSADIEWTAADSEISSREGWSVFNLEDGRPEIQRDDELDVFKDDDAAVAHVRRCAAAGSDLHRRALAVCGVDRELGYLRTEPLHTALFWFIENAEPSAAWRNEAFFILRERMRAEGVMYTRMHHVLERCAQVEGDRVREGQPMSIAHYRKVMRLITEVVT